MELCYHSYAILLGANQLFAAKQHRSDRSNREVRCDGKEHKSHPFCEVKVKEDNFVKIFKKNLENSLAKTVPDRRLHKFVSLTTLVRFSCDFLL